MKKYQKIFPDTSLIGAFSDDILKQTYAYDFFKKLSTELVPLITNEEIAQPFLAQYENLKSKNELSDKLDWTPVIDHKETKTMFRDKVNNPYAAWHYILLASELYNSNEQTLPLYVYGYEMNMIKNHPNDPVRVSFFIIERFRRYLTMALNTILVNKNIDTSSKKVKPLLVYPVANLKYPRRPDLKHLIFLI